MFVSPPSSPHSPPVGVFLMILMSALYTAIYNVFAGVLQKHKWENALTLDSQSWGYRREAVLADYLSMEEIIQQLAITIRCVHAWLSLVTVQKLKKYKVLIQSCA